jgi:tetratricopeptide (TPR) repeat protein
LRIARNSAAYYYLEGKIRNLCVEYDPKAEELLDRCVRTDSRHVEAWLELGNCVWKKPDLAKALTCFNQALSQFEGDEAKSAENSSEEVSREKTVQAKTMCFMSAALRAQLPSLQGRREKVEMVQQALKLCRDALKQQPDYAFGNYSLANTLLVRFFLVGQLQQKDLVGIWWQYMFTEHISTSINCRHKRWKHTQRLSTPTRVRSSSMPTSTSTMGWHYSTASATQRL